MKLAFQILLMCLLIGCSKFDPEFIERITGLELPKIHSNIDAFDNGEFFVVCHFETTPEEMKEFVKRYDFTPSNELLISDIPMIAFLEPGNQRKTHLAPLNFIKGSSVTNSWLVVVEPESMRCWSLIFYPDYGGSVPGPIVLRHEREKQFQDLHELIKTEQSIEENL